MKTSIVLVTLIVSVLSNFLAQAKSSHEKQPNIIVFLVDDMGLMDTSVPFLTDSKNNPQKNPLNDWYHTPNMELLAKKGTRFSQFYAQSVCSPTRASLLTGQNSTRHHTTTWINPLLNNKGKFGPEKWNWQGLNKSDITFPKLLKENGYKTIHIGKGHFGPLKTEGAEPTNIGFDVNIAGGPWGRPKSYYGRNHYGNHSKYKKNDTPLTHNIPHLEAYYEQDVFLTEALTIEANKQIEEAVNQNKPFMLYMSHYAVHAPFDSDPRFTKRYENRDKSEKAQAYATLVEGMDKSLGDISIKLNELGIAENTLIIFLGDNGSDAPLGKDDVVASSAPLKGKKGTSWEGGMRAPLIVAWAKPNLTTPNQKAFPITQSYVNPQIASILDIFPTILAATSIIKPESAIVDGANLAIQLSGHINKERNNSFLMHFPHKHRHSYFTAYRLNDWKVIYHYNPENKKRIKQYQLFNLANDLTESQDLSTSNPKQLNLMMKSMIKALKDEDAQYPIDKTGNILYPLLPTSISIKGEI